MEKPNAMHHPQRLIQPNNDLKGILDRQRPVLTMALKQVSERNVISLDHQRIERAFSHAEVQELIKAGMM
jgi:hypothetical protein